MRCVTLALLTLACSDPKSNDTGGDDTGGGDTIEFDSGFLYACMGTDDTEAEVHSSRVEVDGTVVSHAGIAADAFNIGDTWQCDEAGLALAIEDEGGHTWWVGLGGHDGEGAIVVDAGIAEGTPVSLQYQLDTNESGTYFGLVVRDGDALRLVAEQYRLDPLPEFSVARADALVTQTDACGTRTWYATTFSSDDSVTLVPGEVGTLTVDGEAMQVRAVDNCDWSGEQCTDLGGARAWVMTRPG